MKKVVPFIILLIGLLVFAGVYFFVIRDDGSEIVDDEDTSAMIEVSFEDRPLVSLIPRADGHWLDLKIENLGAFPAAKFEYLLRYDVPGKPSQGAQAEVVLDGNSVFEKEILLGTESSGNYYYDSGVEKGEITIRFRNADDKLVAKFETDFHLQSEVSTITSLDGTFTMELEEEISDYFVVLETIGSPAATPSGNEQSPFGVFTSLDDSYSVLETSASSVFTDGSWKSFVPAEFEGALYFSN